jgi:hypothetical protein
MNGGIMKHTPLIRWALAGISVALAALLMGFAATSATAATRANAQQSHPVAATTAVVGFAGVAPTGGAYYPPYHHRHHHHHHRYRM